MSGACCTPNSNRGSSRIGQSGGGVRPPTLIELPGGSFLMGDESAWAYPGDGEGPVHEVFVCTIAEALLRRALACFQRMGVVFEAALTKEQLAAIAPDRRLRPDCLAPTPWPITSTCRPHHTPSGFGWPRPPPSVSHECVEMRGLGSVKVERVAAGDRRCLRP